MASLLPLVFVRNPVEIGNARFEIISQTVHPNGNSNYMTVTYSRVSSVS